MRPVTITNEMRGKGIAEDRAIREVESHQTFAEAVASISTDVLHQLEVERIEDVSADITVPHNITLRFTAGGRLRVATGVTVTIEGDIIAGIQLRQIFECVGTGAVIVAARQIYPNWWGAVGDATVDCTDAINAALVSAHAVRTRGLAGGLEPEVIIAAGTFMASNIIVWNGSRLRGYGPHHSRLKMISGSVGTFIEEYDNAVGTVIAEMMVDGNSCTADGINLGNANASYPHGTFGGLFDLYVTGFDGWGIKTLGNAAHYDRIEITNCTNGFYLDGSGNMVHRLMLSGGAIGLDITAALSHVSQVHLEGAHATAGIRCQGDADLTVIHSVDCYIGGGNTVGTVIKIESGAGNVICHGIRASIPDGTLTNGIIYDQSLAADRIVLGNNNAVETYKSGTGFISREGQNAPPTTGDWIKGDVVLNGSSDAGQAIGWICEFSGSPGTWSCMGTVPGHIPVTQASSPYAVNVTENGTRFSNEGATGAVEFDLPAMQENLEYEFIKVANQPFTINPNGTQQIAGGGAGTPLTLANVGDCVRLGRLGTGEWAILRKNY